MRRLMLIAGALSAVTGLILSAAVLAVSRDPAQQLPLLVLLTVVLATSQTWFQITDSGILAAQKSQFLGTRAISFGVVKIGMLFAVVGAGASGLFAAYVLPLLAIVIVSLFFVDRLWPERNERGTPVHLRELANLSFGNWISGLVYSIPSRVGPSIMLIALIAMGSKLGLVTLAAFVIFLIRGVPADWLPLAWVIGGTLALGVGWLLSRRRTPTKAEPQAISAEPRV